MFLFIRYRFILLLNKFFISYLLHEEEEEEDKRKETNVFISYRKQPITDLWPIYLHHLYNDQASFHDNVVFHTNFFLVVTQSGNFYLPRTLSV